MSRNSTKLPVIGLHVSKPVNFLDSAVVCDREPQMRLPAVG